VKRSANSFSSCVADKQIHSPQIYNYISPPHFLWRTVIPHNFTDDSVDKLHGLNVREIRRLRFSRWLRFIVMCQYDFFRSFRWIFTKFREGARLSTVRFWRGAPNAGILCALPFPFVDDMERRT